MEFLREYALLIAVATPVVVIIALQAYLYARGERGTLLMPSVAPFESITIEPGSEATAQAASPERSVPDGEVDKHLKRIAA